MKWISVKDRLPKDEQYVIAYEKDDLMEELSFSIVSLEVYGGERKWLENNGINFPIDRYSFWMPLPKKPEVTE